MKLENVLYTALNEAKKSKVENNSKPKRVLKECGDCERKHDWTHGHDHEARMAKGELRDMLVNGAQIYKMIGNEDELPGWISAYITLASDYMHSIAEYMTEQSEEESMEAPMASNLPSFAIYEGDDDYTDSDGVDADDTEEN